MREIIKRGAESIIYLDNRHVIKERVKKGYRQKDLDLRIRKSSTRKEIRLIEKARKVGVNVPLILHYNEKDMRIEMQFVGGDLLKEILDNINKSLRLKICKKIGEDIVKLHDNNIIHGDLTTSNMFLWKDNIYFIDFGLGFISNKIEDKAVDLHLLKQAFESKHYKYWEECFKSVLIGYKKSRNYRDVIKRLEKVEKRGRYKKK